MLVMCLMRFVRLVCFIICRPVQFACTEAVFFASEIADSAQTENWTNCIFPRRILISKCLVLGAVYKGGQYQDGRQHQGTRQQQGGGGHQGDRPNHRVRQHQVGPKVV